MTGSGEIIATVIGSALVEIGLLLVVAFRAGILAEKVHTHEREIGDLKTSVSTLQQEHAAFHGVCGEGVIP